MSAGMGGWGVVRGGKSWRRKSLSIPVLVSWSLGDWGNNGKQGEDVGEGGCCLEKVVLFERSFLPVPMTMIEH